MDYVLGIDGGGTTTVCVLMRGKDRVLGRGLAGASNYHNMGIEGAFNSIRLAVLQAISEAGVNPEIRAICLGMAGVSRPEDFQVIHNLVQQLQVPDCLPLKWSLHPNGLTICSDSEIALVAGTGHKHGIVAIAGTGSIVFGRNPQGQTKRVGGWGPLLGDDGSAYQIAVLGMRAALQSEDGLLGDTVLKQSLIECIGIKSIKDLVQSIDRSDWDIQNIAALAPIVDRAAAAGDKVAKRIIDQAVQSFVEATRVAIETLFSYEAAFEVVTMGSVWQGQSGMRQQFESTIKVLAPNTRIILPQHESAYGAGLLALGAL